jgi:hypothetical protein
MRFQLQNWLCYFLMDNPKAARHLWWASIHQWLKLIEVFVTLVASDHPRIEVWSCSSCNSFLIFIQNGTNNKVVPDSSITFGEMNYCIVSSCFSRLVFSSLVCIWLTSSLCLVTSVFSSFSSYCLSSFCRFATQMVNGTSRCGLKPWYPIAFDWKSLQSCYCWSTAKLFTNNENSASCGLLEGFEVICWHIICFLSHV